MKVYCKNCKYVDDRFIGYHNCTHPKNTIYRDNPYERIEEYDTINKFNKDNDCKLFTAKKPKRPPKKP